MKLPERHENHNKGYCKLNKALYGLKQAGREWNQTISKFLIKKGLYQLRSEQCLFAKWDNKNNVICLVAIYVDDMLITGIKKKVLILFLLRTILKFPSAKK